MFRKKERPVLAMSTGSSTWLCDLILADDRLEALGNPSQPWEPSLLIDKLKTLHDGKFIVSLDMQSGAYELGHNPKKFLDYYSAFFYPYHGQFNTSEFGTFPHGLGAIPSITRVELISLALHCTLPKETRLQTSSGHERLIVREIPGHPAVQVAIDLALIYSVDPKHHALPPFRKVIETIDYGFQALWINQWAAETMATAIQQRDTEWLEAIKRIAFTPMAQALGRSKLSQDDGPTEGNSQTVATVKKALVALAVATERASTPKSMLTEIATAMEDWTEGP